MPSNEQRRDAAKRKLERQLEERAAAARKRKRLTIAGSVLAVVLLAAGGVGLYEWKFKKEPEPVAPAMPDLEAKPATVKCSYPKTPTPAAKAVKPPAHTAAVPTSGKNATVSVSVDTSQGPIGLTLDASESPCTVNSFASLISQHYFDRTKCHRLTTEGIKVLQCGDPSGTGTGSPGYRFANEYPTDQYRANDPKAQDPVAYNRGVIAMANAGPGDDGSGTNGSQFFLVYGDSPLPPQYTVFGTIDKTGLDTLDKIAAAGDDAANGPGDGAPKKPVTINSIRLD